MISSRNSINKSSRLEVLTQETSLLKQKIRAKKWINLIILLTSFGLSLIFTEWIFYKYIPQPTYAVKFCPWGFEHIPNISFKHITESRESVSYIQYNSEGFRGPAKYLIQKPEGTLRIAILGDSTAEGAEVDYQDLHGTILEEKLNSYLKEKGGKYRQAEVIKAGVYAYDSCQELRLFESRVLKYKPDVVFIIYSGELEENTTFCELDSDTLMYIDMDYSKVQYVVRYALGYLKAKSHVFCYLTRVFRHTFGRSFLLPKELDKTYSFQPPDRVNFANERPPQKSKKIQYYMSIPDDEIIGVLPNSYEHLLLFAIFEKFYQLIKGYGGDMYIVFCIEKPSTYALCQYAHKVGIRYLDIFDYINDHRYDATGFKIDSHWNKHGHHLVGQAFFELIREQYLCN